MEERGKAQRGDKTMLTLSSPRWKPLEAAKAEGKPLGECLDRCCFGRRSRRGSDGAVRRQAWPGEPARRTLARSCRSGRRLRGADHPRPC
jgi:hypothetical protein